MKVLKFGGTSVGTVASLRNVKKIIEDNREPVMVIVSALGGLTDKLIATSAMAAAGNPAYKEEVVAIRERHHNIIDEVIIPERKDKVLSLVDPMLDELENYNSVSGHSGIHMRDFLTPVGLMGGGMTIVFTLAHNIFTTNRNRLIEKTSDFYNRIIDSGQPEYPEEIFNSDETTQSSAVSVET